MSKRVKPDGLTFREATGDSPDVVGDAYLRSTILRVIDEEIARLDHPDYDTSAEVAVLRTLRARFEEADDE